MKRVISFLCTVVLCFTALSNKEAASKSVKNNAQQKSKFSASFLQNWLCRDWTEERWIQEFAAAKSAGFDSLILQSIYDIIRGNCDTGGNVQDVNDYSTSESFCMFPSSQMATYHSAQNSGDALSLALQAAKQTDMRIWLGTISDDIWWQFGWGVPTSYFEEWSNSNAAMCSDLIAEMWERYGDNYGAQIAGWYYTNEIWNIDAACDGSDNGEYARIIGKNIRSTISTINEVCPEKPLIISPFYNVDISEPKQFGNFINDLINAAKFRDIDIYAPQNGGGREYAPNVIQEWAQAQRNAIDGKMQFWINHECFNADLSPKTITALRENYDAVSDLADGHILFSWNHYYAIDSELNEQFTDYTSETISGDINADGKFDVSDVVLLQKWLLAVPDTHIPDWKAGNFCNDDRLDVFDLCLMKKELVNKSLSLLNQ